MLRVTKPTPHLLDLTVEWIFSLAEVQWDLTSREL
jgi:hypothetical protein